MPYVRRQFKRFRRRVRRNRAGSRSFRGRPFRARATNRRFRRPVTGIPLKKSIKVRKEFTWNINPEAPGAGVSWNQLMVGSAQSANLTGWLKYQGNSTTGTGGFVGGLLDPNGSTGIRQWFTFYERYVVHASKLKIELFAPDSTIVESRGLAVTLVPTVDYHLADIAGNNFDQSNIDPAELPMAKRILLPTGGAPNNATTRKMSSYVSIKKMLNIKDIQDVAGTIQPGTAPHSPYVPFIASPTTSALSTQPQAGLPGVTWGVFWNIVFQEIGRYAEPLPTNPFHAGVSMKITQTSYIQYSDRIPLTSS